MHRTAHVCVCVFRAGARAVPAVCGADRAAVARGVLAGSAVPQTVADRWVGSQGALGAGPPPRCETTELGELHGA